MTPEIERSSLDGVTVLRLPSPAAGAPSGRVTAGLTFRVGRFDETLPTSGITRLAARLAVRDVFPGKERPGYRLTAEVDGRFTTFRMEAPSAAGITALADAVCRGLAGDQGHALDAYKRALRKEAQDEVVPSALARCLAERYGAAGPGLHAFREYGLYGLDWTQVEDWRRRWLVAGNAVLWVIGEVPGALRLSVPPGPAAPVAAPSEPQRVAGPGFVLAGTRGVGLSLVGRRGGAHFAAVAVLTRRLPGAVRGELGREQTVYRDITELDSELSHTWFAVNAPADDLNPAAQAMLTSLEDLARNGCADEELSSLSAKATRDLSAAGDTWKSAERMLASQARVILNGHKDRDLAAIGQSIAEAGPDDVRQAAAVMHGHAVVWVPRLVQAITSRMPQLPSWSADTLAGQVLAARGPGPTLTVGGEGVMLTIEERFHVTVRFTGLAALIRWKDGKRTMVAADGCTLLLDPGAWTGGGKAIRHVDALTAPELIVSIDAPGPLRQDSYRCAVEGPRLVRVRPSRTAPAPVRRAWWAGMTLCVLLTLAGLALVTTGQGSTVRFAMGFALIIVANAVAFGTRRLVQRMSRARR